MIRRHGRPSLLIALALAIAGCSPMPVPPPQDVEEALAAAAPENAELAASYGVDDAWWTVYGDIQLDSLVENALAANIDLARAAVTTRKALYQAYLAGVDLRPEFSGGLDASLRKNVKDGGNTAQSFGGDLGVSYEVDLWRRLRDVKDARTWEYFATKQDQAASRLATIHAVIDAYYHLAYLRDSVDAILGSMDRYEKIEAMTRDKYESGKVASIESVQARQSWLGAKATLIDLQAQQKVAEQTLRNLLNLKPADLLACDPPSLVDYKVPELDLAGAPLSALSNRPDLRAAEYRLRKAFKDFGAERKSWYPTVTIGGSLNSSGSRVAKAFDLPFAGGTVAVNFPFLQWNRVKWNIRISETDYEDTRLAFEETLTAALNEVDVYHFRYLKARETLANNADKLENDIQVSAYYRNRYDAGANEISDWLDALNTETNSRLSLADARYQVIQYENQVYKAMAGRPVPALSAE